ncbi:MAG: histidine kinase dimerization/phospho-acceptor domain-containing protein [Kofleriaceae bacterium]
MASAIVAASRRWVAFATRIRYRLLLINVIVAAVPVVGIGFANMHETQLLAALETDMIHQAQLVRTMIRDPRGLAELRPALVRAARETRTRIRLLDARAAVVADSHYRGPPEGAEPPVPRIYGESPGRSAEVPQPVELAQRREIQAALAGHYGSATRLWDAQQRVYLFAALPIFEREVAVGVVYVTRSTHDVKLQLFRLRRWLTQVLIATIAITALISLVLATTIARPLARLTRRAQRIAAREPVEPADDLAGRTDEIGQLARAVEAMTRELERRAGDARTLAADISHEFKTPLTSIRAATELLQDGAADQPDTRDRFLAIILADTQRLDRLVSRLLELARLEDDRSAHVPIDLVRLARDCAMRPWPVAIELTVNGDSVVSGRSRALASALENLVANACQHAAPSTPVRITVGERPGFVRIAVENAGPALSAAARAKVWDRFYSTRHASGGSGLGLAIVRSVALAHGGGVGVDCTGDVTTFWLDVRSRPNDPKIPIALGGNCA